MVVDHVSGTCGFAICGMIFEEFCRYRKILHQAMYPSMAAVQTAQGLTRLQ